MSSLKSRDNPAFFVFLGMNRKIFLLLCLFAVAGTHGFSQLLKPGFDAKEYCELLSLAEAQYLNKDTNIPHYELTYRSPEMGLKNRWDLWVKDNQVGIISIRGTVRNMSSWLANFYSVMVPATGTLQVNDSTKFHYKFAENPKAAVHAGWTIGVAYLGPDIVQKIKQLRTEKNIREFIVFGHSQGGALSFLTTSYLYYLQKNGQLPSDLSFKSYCSAAPKPGNMYYAYDYDFITRGSKSFTVVNSEDWVPETPFSIQTEEDLNSINPFINIDAFFARQKILARWYLKRMYNNMDKSSKKARNRYEKYLGKKIYPLVKKSLPQLREPAYAGTMNYMRAGTPIVLLADSLYHEQFNGTKESVWIHHGLNSYKYLASKIYLEEGVSGSTGH